VYQLNYNARRIPELTSPCNLLLFRIQNETCNYFCVSKTNEGISSSGTR